MKNDITQLIKYILTGIWNTFFGITLYTVAIIMFGEKHYLLINIFCNIIAITQSYISYKVFVFKTKDNYIKEYLKIYVTYGTTFAVGIIGLYILVDIMHNSAILSNIIMTLINIVISFFMNKNFTFKKNA